MLFRLSQYWRLVWMMTVLMILLVFVAAPVRAVTVWQPKIGDYLLVDTAENVGYLVHAESGEKLAFTLVTGQKRWVYYIGRYYFAATPEQEWEVKSLDTLGDRYTFGPEGRFLRLFKEGERRTSYGIHSHKQIEVMLAQAERYKSMGCILVSEAMMDLLEETFLLNGQTLKVVSYSSSAAEL